MKGVGTLAEIVERKWLLPECRPLLNAANFAYKVATRLTHTHTHIPGILLPCFLTLSLYTYFFYILSVLYFSGSLSWLALLVTGCRYYVPHSKAANTGDLHYRGVPALGSGGLDRCKYYNNNSNSNSCNNHALLPATQT